MNNKKIGILTFHDADNLGAVLQAYALKSVIENEFGVSAQIINYKCKKISEVNLFKKGMGIKGLLKSVPMSVYYKIKHNGFEKFRKERLDCSGKAFHRHNIKEIQDLYDAFITGSDQVWNPECSDADSTYVLDFVSDKFKKYSYAASIGNYNITKSDSEWINSIAECNGISVREQSAEKMLKNVGIDNALVHCDPVMLLSNEQWKEIMEKPIIKQKYILVYLVLPDVNVMKQANEYAEKHNCKIINNKRSIEFILHNSPDEFLSWIYNADYIFTNSFHGTAFSLIFNKPVFADIEMQDGSVNHRVADLLNAAKSEKLYEMKVSSLEYLKEICRKI